MAPPIASPSPVTPFRRRRRCDMAFRAEVPIGAPVQDVWEALTTPSLLEQWFCEHADVDLDAGRYDFWGRYTPDVPSREEGRHPIIEVEPYSVLRFQWPIRGLDT